jgi:hypothetical protein
MRHTILIAALLICSSAIAADFKSRITEAKQVNATHEGAQYDAALVPYIGAAMRACIPPGSTDPANLGSFTLVGDVTTTGTLKSVAVEPQTKVSLCFAEHFSKSILPNPPAIAMGNGYPVVVEMLIAP